MNGPAFYFTSHARDMRRDRMIEGAAVMLVASAFWNADRQRFRIARPPADWLSSIVIDSGGFTAAKRWGRYPWTGQQYVDFIREMSRGMQLDFCAVMDYACERKVNRGIFATNRERIKATIRNELALRELAPDLPWLSVLQGHSLDERRLDIGLRQRLGLISPYMGVGSICGRPAREAAAVLRFYGRILPGVRFHGFGLDVRVLDQGDDLYSLVGSWDSYAWTWPRGGRDGELRKLEGESWSTYTGRLARIYADEAVRARLVRPRQLALGLQV